MTADHGPIHLLINNAARMLGKPFKELSVESFKMTMDINFMAYVQLTKLFLSQANLNTNYHLINLSSIGGHMTCQKNTDYSASKYALVGFFESLRMELEIERSPVKLTNFYPYYFNSGLVEGFKPSSLVELVFPTLELEFVGNRVVEAILAEEQEVYIRSSIYYLKIVVLLLPLSLRNWII
jgi:short-subunit dehydrogenase